MNLKTIVLIWLSSILIINVAAQKTYSLQECDLSFSSTEDFVAVYDNPGYAVYKSQQVEVTLNIIRFFDKSGMDKELNKYLPEKEYTVTKKGKVEQDSDTKGVFAFADRKGYSSKFVKGLIMKGGKTMLVEIKFEPVKESEVQKIVESFFALGDDYDEPVSPKPSQQATADNNKPATTSTPSTESKPKQDEPKEPEKQQGPKHPPVSHPNLVQLTAAQKQEFIDAHNRWRSDVGVPPLKWSNDLENYAAEWAVINGKLNCNMEHRTAHLYGENLYWSSGMDFSPKGAVDSWGSEIKDYHGEVVGQSKGVVGHYTQIVWRTTTEVGCAAFKCGSALLVVCNYNPPGNWRGQHPYKQ
jgi:uncharacterized protein YkwD